MRHPLRALFVPFALFVVLPVFATRADVTLNKLFGDHMVLQRSPNTPIFGTAGVDEPITITIATQSIFTTTATAIGAYTTADAHGLWATRLDLSKLQGPVNFTVRGKTNTVTLNDVLVGEVWLCSGQSNMEYSLAWTKPPAVGEIAKADCPQLRMFVVKKATAYRPLATLDGNWFVCSPKTVASFSAVGYYFGKEINQKTGMPVGLIGSYWGGTTAEAWTSAQGLAASPYLTKFADIAKQLAENPPSTPATSPSHLYPSTPAILYNAMINPIVGFGIRGVIWYQGESNASRAVQYRVLFRRLILDWRDHWDQSDLPFYFVQLPNWIAHSDQPGAPNYFSDWAELREAQLRALKLPNTGMAVTIDVGEAHNLHPRDKQTVGHRLALIALAHDYGQKIEYSGPLFDRLSVDGATATVTFTHADGLRTKDNATLQGFELADIDHHWFPAKATIDANTIHVTSDKVTMPVAVRYGWADNPTCNLFNSADLPASPFRSDDWPRHTTGAD